ncbi:MAG TPA: branched-chain amino acid ABC transporter substrate-binding protein [Solirubrobacterales bacterium]|nr:branched-chain amino acid ABC transporter substrate-binding protein [Solirubrobacterales bacterium]HMU25949.1 branched-chain amino acid ABC transporter substrate-binding protein [Solirubrobacterales bacterium]HMY24738.1 branched-chain amino acid ABC transporter substrate-binding protein [Solirubrobacterales bacterium]HNC05892.1 branched-chain amino acid ABC transporter substrate-binding protein [Solirubrobacterales bacterium]HNI39526.1 branched-chain amino acid ABC transporter substrate-bind
MSKHVKLLLGLGALAIVAMVIVACGSSDDSSDDSGNVAGVSADTCGEMTYGGEGSPDALIVSDLPLQGDSADRSKQMNDAVTQVLDTAGWKAGNTTIGFQACDDSLADTGLWDEQTCKDNATAYSDDKSVIGVVGTYNSGCAQAMIPILNQADGGSVAMVSPGNTAICLTESADTCTDGTPDSLYPAGDRNYARVVPNDAAQGAGLVTYAAGNGIKRVAVLFAANDDTSYGQAQTFINASGPGGVKVTEQLEWDPEAASYTDLMNKVKKSDPDGILLAGLTEQNGGQLIKDKVAVFGPNDGSVALMAPDGFAQQSTIDEAGPASAGMIATVPGRAPELLSDSGKQFVKQLESKTGGQPVEIYAPYAGQAAQVLLDAIESAGNDRAGVARALYGIKVTDGITGDFTITDTGDPDVSPITVNKAGKEFEPVEVIEPKANLIKAARGQ